MEPMADVMTRNFGSEDASRSGKKAWIRTRGPRVLISKCLRTESMEALSVGPISVGSISPALEIRTSTLLMLCFDLSS